MSLKAGLPPPVVRWVEMWKMRRRIDRYGAQLRERVLRALGQCVDLERVRRLREEMREMRRSDPTGAAKYADADYWLLLNIERAARTGLVSSPPLRILDIGCGPGYFLAVARALGHSGQGVDLPIARFSSTERQVYGELLAALRLAPAVSGLEVEPFLPLALEGGPFDLITAFWICFNRHRQPDEWGLAEWEFFVQDALRRLAPGGRLYLELNENPDRYGALRWYDEQTREYFLSAGSLAENRVTIVRPG